MDNVHRNTIATAPSRAPPVVQQRPRRPRRRRQHVAEAQAAEPGPPCGRFPCRVPSASSWEDAATAPSTAAPPALPRRTLLATAVAAAVAATHAGPAAASKLPESVDRAWEGLGGGPADLVLPDDFLGVWDVDSVLSSVETPLGPEFVPDMRVVQRARQEDLDAVVRYQVAFLRNRRGEVVPDRAFNTASLLHAYTGVPAADVRRRIRWDADDPNELQLELGGMQVSTRVTRRSCERLGADRLATSEFFQQLLAPSAAAQPKVKASQCFTKYRWRSAAAAAAGGGGGVQIVATQVVSDYLTSFDDPALMMGAQGSPVVVYTYKMTFRRSGSGGGDEGGVGVVGGGGGGSGGGAAASV